MLATITQKLFLIMKITLLSLWYCIILLFEGDYIYITPVVDQLLFLLLIPGSTCLPDHLVHLQSCRPEMQVGKASRASLNVPSFGLQFWIYFLPWQLNLHLSFPIAKAKISYTN